MLLTMALHQTLLPFFPCALPLYASEETGELFDKVSSCATCFVVK